MLIDEIRPTTTRGTIDLSDIMTSEILKPSQVDWRSSVFRKSDRTIRQLTCQLMQNNIVKLQLNMFWFTNYVLE